MASWPDATPDGGHGRFPTVTKKVPHAATTRPNAARVKARAATGPIAWRATSRPTTRATRTTASAKLAAVDGGGSVWAQLAAGADGNWPAMTIPTANPSTSGTTTQNLSQKRLGFCSTPRCYRWASVPVGQAELITNYESATNRVEITVSGGIGTVRVM